MTIINIHTIISEFTVHVFSCLICLILIYYFEHMVDSFQSYNLGLGEYGWSLQNIEKQVKRIEKNRQTNIKNRE